MGLILNRKTNHIKKSTVVFYSGTLVLLALFSTKSFAVDLLNYQLKDLKSVETHNLDQYRGNTFLMIFFQPDCPFCVKQSKVINEIQAECSDFQAIGVGVNSSRSDPQVDARKMRADYPTYEISAPLQAEVGKVVGTPLMLVADKQGVFTEHLQGYQKMDSLIPILGKAGLNCI